MEAAEVIELRPNPGPQEAYLSTAADIAFYGGAAGSGKMLPVDEPVPTPSGWTAMGALQVGDVVFDERGEPTEVVQAHPVVTPPECWRLTFDDGSSIEACSEHLWLTYDAAELARMTRTDPEWRAKRRASRPSRATGKRSEKFTAAIAERNRKASEQHESAPVAGSVRTTRDIVDTLRTASGRANHAMPVAGALHTPHADLPLDPYLLGAWLGDGTSSSGQITSADREIVDAFVAAGHSLGAVQSPPGNAASSYRIIGLTTLLRSMGLLNAKRVPQAYLRASREQRIEVLRGLMDTDGYASKTGALEFTTTSPALRDGMCELIVSLGMKASCTEGVATLNGRAISPKWRIKFTAPFAAFRLARKASRQRLATRRTNTLRYVVAAERVTPRPMRCIAVASPSRLYLAGRSMLVTHNTFATVLDPLRHIHRKGFTAVVLRRTTDRLQGGGSVWAESGGIYPLLGGVPRETPTLQWRWPSGAMLQMLHLQHEKDVHSHQSKQYAAIYFEEVCEFTEHQFWYLLSRNRTTCGIRPYVRGTCNPDPDSFVRRLIDWWIGPDGLPIRERSGVLRWFVRDGDDLVWFDTAGQARERFPDRGPLSFTFIAANLADNPKGDPTYADKLQILARVERERLLGGNWNVRAHAGDYFKRRWFCIVEPDDPIIDEVTRWCRSWDLAATEVSEKNKDPDWTAGTHMGTTRDGALVIRDMEHFRGGPGAVEDAIVRLASQDGRNCTVAVWQDPGQAGKAQVAHQRKLLTRKGYVLAAEPATSNKETYAKLWSPVAERGDVYLVRGPWNEALISACEAFPTPGVHDDPVDAVSRGYVFLTRGGAPIKSGRVEGI